MAELPIMPFKTDAFLADTSHMSAEELGAYTRVLLVMWRHGGMIPDDDRQLANIAGVPSVRWKKIAETIRRPLTAAGGMLSQKRLTDTWIDVQTVRKKRALASAKRWGNRSPPNGMQMHNQMESIGNANQNQISNLSSFVTPAREGSDELKEAIRKKKWAP